MSVTNIDVAFFCENDIFRVEITVFSKTVNSYHITIGFLLYF